MSTPKPRRKPRIKDLAYWQDEYLQASYYASISEKQMTEMIKAAADGYTARECKRVVSMYAKDVWHLAYVSEQLDRAKVVHVLTIYQLPPIHTN